MKLRGAIPAVSLVTACFAQVYLTDLDVDHAAIRYFEGPTDDPVARLSRQLRAGEIRLAFRNDNFGYLPDLLERLGVNPDSQALVFSKSSFQGPKISPRNPRAIYFGDQSAVGFVPGGSGLEVAAVDPRQGIMLYSLNRDEAGKPVFERQKICLTCHQGPSTLGVPGIFVGSVFPNSDGMPAREGAIVTDHRTPFADRWGGWYVNATRGEQKDRANAVASNPAEPDVLDIGSGQNVPRIEGQFNAASYLKPTSDIVALMTLEHQTQMTNFLTRLNWEGRIGSHDPEVGRRIENDIEATVAYMLFADEPPLHEPIEGVSTFAKTFPQRGPRDGRGRSLRDFDLRTRLFRYPLSYMIYTPQFDNLPEDIRGRIYRRLYAVLTDPKRASSENVAILEILGDTKSDLPQWWPARSHASGR